MNFPKRWIAALAIFLLVGYFFQSMPISRAQDGITSVQAVAWSPNGSQIAMGGYNDTAIILAVRNADMSIVLDLSATPGGQTQSIMSVSWSPDGKYLVSGSSDGTIAVWAINDPSKTPGQLLAKFGNFDMLISDVAWSPDGKWIASITYARQISIWNATSSGYRLVDSTEIDASGSLSWSLNSQWLGTSTNNGAFIYNISTTGTFVTTAQYRLLLDPSYGPASGVSWNVSGSQIAVANRLANKIFIFDWPAGSTGTPNRILTLTSAPGTLAWSPDGTKFAFAEGTNSVRVVNAANGSELANYATGMSSQVDAISWNPDGSKLAFSSAGDTAQVVDVPDIEAAAPTPVPHQ